MTLADDLLALIAEWEVDYSRVGYDSREQHENDFMIGEVIPALRRLLERRPSQGRPRRQHTGRWLRSPHHGSKWHAEYAMPSWHGSGALTICGRKFHPTVGQPNRLLFQDEPGSDGEVCPKCAERVEKAAKEAG